MGRDEQQRGIKVLQPQTFLRLMYFLYHRVSSKTGKMLGTALGIRRGQGRTAEQRPPLIRWGNAERFDAETILNQREAILLASDKLGAFTCMAEAGVRVPEFSRHAPAEGLWFGRRRHGYGGRDIRIVENGNQNLYGEVDFYTRYIPNRREYRVHVFNGEIIRLQGKWLDYPHLRTSPYIQNAANGYAFRTPNYRLNRERTDMAIKAVEALGLDFGAVDLLIGQDGLTYILEVNTAPGCRPMTARAYVDAIRAYCVEQGHTMPAITYNTLEALRGSGSDAEQG